MPPSAIHMDHVRSQHRHHQMAALERRGAEMAGDAAETGASREVATEGDTGRGMSFWDVLDVINPLQHIPVVNRIYQAVTGDTIGTPAKIAGAALFFGPVGVALASADAVVKQTTGKDTLGQVADLLGLDLDKTASPAGAGDDDPFTVTAPRPRRTADAGPATPAPPAAAGDRPIPELTDGQAALLESLMAQQGAAATATSASATSPAAGGIATAGQLRKLESTPGADAALAAARGVGLTGVVASLPTPGAPASGSNLLAAMSQEQPSAQPARTGRSLADYRANAVHSGSMVPKPMLASRPEQMVRTMGGGMPGAAFAPAAAPVSTPSDAATKAADKAADHPSPAPLPAASQDGATATRDAAAWPPEGPAALPKELIADMMAQAMNKYESQARRRADATAAGNRGATVH